jgi:predicted acylesterase/phospholipase RssA
VPIREGLVRRAARASASFPGLFPPVPHEGNLIVDGGLFSNLPIDLMAERCPGPILASDVSREIEMQVDPALSAAPSPWRLLWSRFPFARRVRFPSLSEILMRAIDAREAARRAELRRSAAFCFLPPVAEFSLDQLAALDEIVALGSRYAAARILELPSSIARRGDDG